MRIRALTLPSPDPGRLVRFYERLGFSARSDRGAPVVTIGHTDVTVVDGPVPRGAHHLAITIAGAALPRAREVLATHAPLRTRDGHDQFHLDPPFGPADSVYADDPDGSLVELIARDTVGGDRDDRNGGFDATTDVRGVGEVAVPVGSVRDAVAELGRARGLVPVLSGPGFAAVGDHVGMIILVSPDRAWFPTDDRYPEPTPLRLTVEPGGPTVTLSNGTTLV